MVAKTSTDMGRYEWVVVGSFQDDLFDLNGCEDINGYEQTRMGGCREGFR